MNLKEMQSEVEEVNRQKGWYDKERTFGEDIALIHSEVSEALEAYRRWGIADATPACYGNPSKPEGVGSEFADVLIRLLDICERYGIDLEAEYRRKMAYNRTRPYRHGNKRI